MDQIDLASLTLRFLARFQLLRESTQLYRSAPHLPHDTSYFCGGQCISAVDEPRKRPHCLMCLGYGGDKNIKITNALSRECWTRSLRVTAHRHVSSGVAPCQSEILSLKKVVWRQWLVSKSRTKSSVEGCEQLLRRAASVARPSSSPSHARSVLSRTMCGRTDPPLWGLLARFSDGPKDRCRSIAGHLTACETARRGRVPWEAVFRNTPHLAHCHHRASFQTPH
jgi:hypothetical protein